MLLSAPVLSLLVVTLRCSAETSAPQRGEWFIPAPLNYGTWAQEIDYDFPDGDVDGKLAKMAHVGMTTYFFRRDTPEFHTKLFAAAREHGIRLHLRMFGIKTLSAQDAADHPEWLFSVEWARQRRMACPSWIEVWESDLPEQERFLRQNRDHLFGINVDFIRYPDDDPCLCARCRRLYEQHLGRDSLTEEDLADPAVAAPYIQLRCSVIEQMIRRLRDICDRLGLKLSVAVFTNRDHGRFLGQDWVAWAQEGLVDFVCPMNYTHDRDDHRKWLQEHVRSMGDHAELWEAVARAWSGGENPPQEVLNQSLDVLLAGADGISSYKMGAFSDDDWRLQEALQAERGWGLQLAEAVLSIGGPPFGEMQLPPWPVRRCRAPGPNPVVQREGNRLLVKGPLAWAKVDLTPRQCRAGGAAVIPVQCHNGTDREVQLGLTARAPEAWRIRKLGKPVLVAAGESRTVRCEIAVPASTEPGDYWVEIDVHDAETGRFIPRAKPAVEAVIDGHRCTVIPVTRTHYTSAPTWLRLTVRARQTREDAEPKQGKQPAGRKGG
jgi:hypothetical protein